MFLNIKKMIWLIPVLAMLCVGWSGSWEQIQKTAGNITSVQAEFVQEKHLPILAKPLVSRGVFYYQEPRSLRWEYQQPVRSILMIHDGRVKQYVAGSSGLKEQRGGGLEAMQIVMEEITQWFKGRFDANPMFKAELAPEGRIILKPKSEAFGAVIDQIVIELSEAPGVIQRVTIYESKTAFTQMTFTHTRLNEKIDEAVFRDLP